MEEKKEFDCFGDGCGKCEVCEYLSFREMAEGCAPGGSTIERNEKIERYLKRKDEEINLAVSKERERIVEKIKLETDAWLRTELLWLQSTLLKKVFITDEIKMEYVDSAIEDILKLINTK